MQQIEGLLRPDLLGDVRLEPKLPHTAAWVNGSFVSLEELRHDRSNANAFDANVYLL